MYEQDDIKRNLEKIREPAIEPLIEVLELHLITNIAPDRGEKMLNLVDCIRDIGDKRAIEPLIKILEDNEDYFYKPAVRIKCAEALGRFGDKRAIEPLAMLLNDEYHNMDGKYTVREAAKKALTKRARVFMRGKIEEKEKENILKFLKSNDNSLVMMGASMLKGIIEE